MVSFSKISSVLGGANDRIGDKFAFPRGTLWNENIVLFPPKLITEFHINQPNAVILIIQPTPWIVSNFQSKLFLPRPPNTTRVTSIIEPTRRLNESDNSGRPNVQKPRISIVNSISWWFLWNILRMLYVVGVISFSCLFLNEATFRLILSHVLCRPLCREIAVLCGLILNILGLLAFAELYCWLWK